MAPSSAERAADFSQRVERTLDAAPLGGFQLGVAALCGCVAMLDGFDGQAIAFAGPALIRQWGLSPSAFAGVVSIGLVGTLLGASLQGPFADRLGRRPLILGATFLFAACAMGCALAASPVQLAALRFISGLGLGAAIVNLTALTGEVVPKRHRAFLISVTTSGLPVGVFLGGALSSLLIEGAGWRAIFWAGGLAPLALGALLAAWLPELPLFLAARGREKDLARLTRLLSRIGEPAVSTPGPAPRAAAAASPATGVISDGRLGVTILLGAVFFFTQLVMFFLLTWTPTVLAQTGLPLRQAVLAASAIGLGAVLGGAVLSWVSDRKPRLFAMALSYATAAGVCALFAVAHFSGFGPLLGLALAAGFFAGGPQGLAYALAVAAYPVSVRARGLGILVAATRTGAICGPLLGGALQTLGWRGREIFAVLAVPLLLVAVAAVGAQLALRRSAAPDA